MCTEIKYNSVNFAHTIQRPEARLHVKKNHEFFFQNKHDKTYDKKDFDKQDRLVDRFVRKECSLDLVRPVLSTNYVASCSRTWEWCISINERNLRVYPHASNFDTWTFLADS